ncbi:Inner membrane protein ypdA [Fibrisoma limi BUZ 3]|uniref:Inner membrane protein ypdA n=1 Tax=Fibrisoma limi BUZ 3 TaxID=1185876 RepID=I2GJK3_9BACT|nr:histidine kinase [Fibrisoma limi]CCH54078.1 Inner membrane protein ypdA [Fibrisoma limi BUZ 3]
MNWNRTTFWGITYYQLALVLGLYAVAALLYDGSLTISQRPWSEKPFLTDFLVEFPRILLDYSLKLLFTAPIWYLLFYRLKHLSLARRLLLHLILLPVFILTWQVVYYAISDALGIGRLRNNGIIWDTYIGSLFYLVQFGIFHAFAYHRDLQKQHEREAKLRELTLKSELSALKAQLNPHFLYNVFNTISASVPPALEHTREMLAQLSDMFRYQLQASKSETVTVRDELTFVMKYLDLEKARFGDRLRVRLAVSDDVLTEHIPPMLLQPLVENSVKHGISPLIDGGEVSIRIERQNGQLHIEVADTGVGLNGTTQPTQPSGGVGLANTVLRLDKMYGSQVHLINNQPSGLTVAFSIPL